MGIEAEQVDIRQRKWLKAPDALTAKAPGKESDTRHAEGLYLLGRPKLRHLLNYARYHAIDPPEEEDLVAEWREAQDELERLRKTEPDLADHPRIRAVPVDERYEPLLVEFLKDPLVQGGFNTVPTEIAFVELDSMVVYQKHIDLEYVRKLQQRIGQAPDYETVFRTCLPFDHPQAPAEWARLDDDGFVFMSPSNDMRYLGSMQLKPEHIQGYQHPGDLVGVIGLAVGFGSNFLNAFFAEGRLILNNGSHRAYALRELGITHVPCVVQHVSNRDELEHVASSEVRRSPDSYLREPRPSMLRDYFNPRLRKIMPVRRQHRQIRVRYSISEQFVPVVAED